LIVAYNTLRMNPRFLCNIL